MPINILMPALSPTMEKGNLAKWLKKEGDKVKSGDVIAEIETDKATMEVEAVDEGTIGKILVPEGAQDIAVNAPIAVLLEEGEDKSAIKDAAPAAPKPAAAKPEAAAAPAAAKAPEAKAAPAPAKAPERACRRLSRRPRRRPLRRPTAAAASSPRRLPAGSPRRAASTSAQVQGSGPHGRVVKADIEAAKAGGGALAKAAPAAAPAPAPPRRRWRRACRTRP